MTKPIKIPDYENDSLKSGDYHTILPAWFCARMMHDEWYFGLMTVTGKIIAISHIDAIIQDSAGDIWFDVKMVDSSMDDGSVDKKSIMYAPTSRLEATIRADSIVAAFELYDS